MPSVRLHPYDGKAKVAVPVAYCARTPLVPIHMVIL